MQEMPTAAPVGGDDGDPGEPTINAKKRRWQAPWEVLTEIRERPPSTLRIIDSGPLRDGAEDPGMPTINAKKRRR
jgi:hypothetical protein